MLFSLDFVPRLLESDKSSNTETLLTTPVAVTDDVRTTTQITTQKFKKKKKPEEKLPESDESSNNQKTKKKWKKSKEKQAKKQPNTGQKSGKNRQLPGSFGTSLLVAVPTITTVTIGLMGDDTTEPTTANMNPRPTTSLPPTITTTSNSLYIFLFLNRSKSSIIPN